MKCNVNTEKKKKRIFKSEILMIRDIKRIEMKNCNRK